MGVLKDMDVFFYYAYQEANPFSVFYIKAEARKQNIQYKGGN